MRGVGAGQKEEKSACSYYETVALPAELHRPNCVVTQPLVPCSRLYLDASCDWIRLHESQPDNIHWIGAGDICRGTVAVLAKPARRVPESGRCRGFATVDAMEWPDVEGREIGVYN
jgi:hypothetical protein